MQKILALLLLLGFFSCKISENEEPSPVKTYQKQTIQYKQISGVDANLLSLDLYHFGEKDNPRPVVIYVHGGAWTLGDKANQLQNKVNLFQSLGYLLVSVNYRLSPRSVGPDYANRVKYPDHNNDVADAVKWCHSNLNTYGGNPNKMALMGHSAGAQLVSLTGSSALFLPTRGLSLEILKGVASIDTEGYDVREAAQATSSKDTYLNAFGSDPKIWAEASALLQVQVGKSYPAFFIAKRGSAARLADADEFIAKLKSVGVRVQEVTGSQYDHEGINDAIGAPNETAITEPLKLFLEACFK
jgi:acetyl esterase/lipase